MTKLLAVLVLLLAALSAAQAWHEVADYCPTNPRRAGKALSGDNLPEFSFLLTCPTGQAAYSPERIVDLGNGEWVNSYIDLDAADYQEMANEELLNFQSLVSNGVVDEAQQACKAWDHAFLADNQAKLLATGSGLPIVVAQDRRYGGQYGKVGLNETGFDYNLLGFNHSNLPNENQVGQWLYSVCSDVSCSSATTPRPFWGRRIGEPLYQDTLAELAYFPVNPDWAYNSPKLGSSYAGQGPDSFGTVAPKHIASTYVWSASGEKILVLLLNGVETGKEQAEREDVGRPIFNATTSWFLVYCQDEDCSDWGVYDLRNNPGTGAQQQQIVLQSNTFAPSLVTSPDGRSVLLVTNLNGPRVVANLKLRSLNKNAEFRNAAMSEIYSSLIGRPAFYPDYNAVDFNLTVDFGIWQDYFGNDYSNGLTDHPLNYMYGYRGLLPQPYFGDSNAPFSQRRPAVACTDLEAAGIANDPWCHWNYYWQPETVVADIVQLSDEAEVDLLYLTPFNTYSELSWAECGVSAGSFVLNARQGAEQAPAFFQNVIEFVQPIVTPDTRFDLVYGDFDGFLLPLPGVQPVAILPQNQLTVLQSPFPNQPYPAAIDRSLVYTGQRYHIIQTANGRPFFTWADLDGSLLDTAMTWGCCGLNTDNQLECRTVFDSLELGTMGYLEGRHGSTVLLRAPDGLPVMIYWFDHFGGFLNQPMIDQRISISPGQITSKPLIVLCLDALCNAASVSAFTPAQLADIANPLASNNGTWQVNNEQFIRFIDTVNPTVNADAAFVGDQLMLLLNEGGRNGEYANNPIRLWRTNRWASPTGLPCSEANAGQSVVANDVVYYCSRLQIGSHDAELYFGNIPRPWTRLYEWIKMDWGFGLRNLGGFLGWGASRDDNTFYDIALDKDPWWTDNANDWLNSGPARRPIAPAPIP